jgi:hypothetical protein
MDKICIWIIEKSYLFLKVHNFSTKKEKVLYFDLILKLFVTVYDDQNAFT